MSFTTTTLAQSRQEAMKIHNTNHDESRDGLPSLSTRRRSASMKVRTFISRRISQNFNSPPLQSHHEESNSSQERPITLFPRLGNRKSSLKDDKSGNTDYQGQIYRSSKTTRKEEGFLSSNDSSGSHLPLKIPAGSPSSRSKGFSLPSLKNKNTFSDLVKEKLHWKPELRNEDLNMEMTKEEAEGNSEKLVKAYNLRQAMLEGKVERVIPPASAAVSTGRNRGPPPRPTHNPYLHNSLPSSISSQPPAPTILGAMAFKLSEPPSSRTSFSSTRPTSRSRKTKSASSRIVSLIGNSADVIDEKRRGIQGRFKEPFEHMPYPSFTLARRVDDSERKSDRDSDESFFCMGERKPGPLAVGLGVGREREMSAGRNGNGVNTETGDEVPGMVDRGRGREFHDLPRPKTRGKGSERNDWNRFSGFDQGREQDAQVQFKEVIKMCKLCGHGNATSMRRLCAECEQGLLPPKPQHSTYHTRDTYSDSEYEDDIIPPTLPLKIRKKVPEKKKSVEYKFGPEAYEQRNPFASDDKESDNEYRPAVPPKDDIFFGFSRPNKMYQPQITSGDPTRQGSHRARIEAHKDTLPEPWPKNSIRVDRASGYESDYGDSPTYKESRWDLDRWSERFGEGAVDTMKDMQEDGVPLGSKPREILKRDQKSYSYWEVIFGEYGPRSSTMEGGKAGPVEEYWVDEGCDLAEIVEDAGMRQKMGNS
ncbi:hypothetical protein ONS95_002315 [Cadophora gregata]|uniref:uncharacterized protein n=1 Tax=Cadophora gregata TaxID=51156 RepID=UPI0026DD3ACD|nr:uncharacterized protein ONS95_002315 [Cadophora gregata]KAK0109634.1 hypothetical protein ONS95_002315 [Cadophora gregata]